MNNGILELPAYICAECGFMLSATLRKQGRRTFIVRHGDNECPNAGHIWEVTLRAPQAEEL